MKIEMRPTDSVRAYDRNPRDNDGAVDAVARSIKEFGFRQSIVVDSDGVIVVGHTRHRAALSLGLAEVPVHVAADLSPAKLKAYRIADNKTGELATWDDDMLATELTELSDLAELPDVDLDMEALGFSDDELEAVTKDLTATLQEVAVYEPPPMTWVLVGIPTVRFGEISDDVEKLSAVSGIECEVTATDA